MIKKSKYLFQIVFFVNIAMACAQVQGLPHSTLNLQNKYILLDLDTYQDSLVIVGNLGMLKKKIHITTVTATNIMEQDTMNAHIFNINSPNGLQSDLLSFFVFPSNKSKTPCYKTIKTDSILAKIISLDTLLASQYFQRYENYRDFSDLKMKPLVKKNNQYYSIEGSVFCYFFEFGDYNAYQFAEIKGLNVGSRLFENTEPMARLESEIKEYSKTDANYEYHNIREFYYLCQKDMDNDRFQFLWFGKYQNADKSYFAREQVWLSLNPKLSWVEVSKNFGLIGVRIDYCEPNQKCDLQGGYLKRYFKFNNICGFSNLKQYAHFLTQKGTERLKLNRKQGLEKNIKQ